MTKRASRVFNLRDMVDCMKAPEGSSRFTRAISHCDIAGYVSVYPETVSKSFRVRFWRAAVRAAAGCAEVAGTCPFTMYVVPTQ